MLSFILPKANYRRIFNKNHDLYQQDKNIIIKHGQLLTGTFNKAIVGPKKNSLIGTLWIDFGPKAASKFLSESQRLINCWLLKYGWSVGI